MQREFGEKQKLIQLCEVHEEVLCQINVGKTAKHSLNAQFEPIILYHNPLRLFQMSHFNACES